MLIGMSWLCICCAHNVNVHICHCVCELYSSANYRLTEPRCGGEWCCSAPCMAPACCNQCWPVSAIAKITCMCTIELRTFYTTHVQHMIKYLHNYTICVPLCRNISQHECITDYVYNGVHVCIWWCVWSMLSHRSILPMLWHAIHVCVNRSRYLGMNTYAKQITHHTPHHIQTIVMCGC